MPPITPTPGPAAPAAGPTLTPERVQRLIDDIAAARRRTEDAAPLSMGPVALPLRAQLMGVAVEALLQRLVLDLAGPAAEVRVQQALDAPWSDVSPDGMARSLLGGSMLRSIDPTLCTLH